MQIGKIGHLLGHTHSKKLSRQEETKAKQVKQWEMKKLGWNNTGKVYMVLKLPFPDERTFSFLHGYPRAVVTRKAQPLVGNQLCLIFFFIFENIATFDCFVLISSTARSIRIFILSSYIVANVMNSTRHECQGIMRLFISLVKHHNFAWILWLRT